MLTLEVLLSLLIGLGALILGRQLFWLFVGAVGFAVGLSLATQYLADQPNWAVLVIGLAAGIIGAVLAYFLQRLAVGVAGFLAGGVILIGFLRLLGLDVDSIQWLLFVVGGIIGALLVMALFDWALILLSALTGATLIVETLREAYDLTLLISLGIFVILFIIGTSIQANMMRRRRVSSSKR